MGRLEIPNTFIKSLPKNYIVYKKFKLLQKDKDCIITEKYILMNTLYNVTKNIYNAISNSLSETEKRSGVIEFVKNAKKRDPYIKVTLKPNNPKSKGLLLTNIIFKIKVIVRTYNPQKIVLSITTFNDIEKKDITAIFKFETLYGDLFKILRSFYNSLNPEEFERPFVSEDSEYCEKYLEKIIIN